MLVANIMQSQAESFQLVEVGAYAMKLQRSNVLKSKYNSNNKCYESN